MRTSRESTLFLGAAGAVLLALAAVELVWRRPPATAAAVAGAFALWTGALWSLGLCRRRAHGVLLVVPWLAAVVLGLAALHQVDRGGWLWLRVSGYDRIPHETVGGRAAADPSSVARAATGFRVDAHGLRVGPGRVRIGRTVVVPRGTVLTIVPGTELRFGPGRSLISFGPVVARGTRARPIRFVGDRAWLAWGVVAVIDAGPSRFTNVELSGSRRAVADGRELPGGLSLVGTDAVVFRSRFEDAVGGDALYVSGARVEVRDSLFRDAARDCVDFDGADGTIAGNTFLDCGDEALDLSGGGGVVVVGNVIRDRRGGRVAVEHGLAEVRARNTFGRTP